MYPRLAGTLSPTPTPAPDDSQHLLSALIDISIRAAAEVMAVYAQPLQVRVKADESPVTLADERAEALIVPALRRLTPSLPVVAEEAVAAGRVTDVSGGSFWLVDPLDGTKEFLARNGEFTVNIALIADGEPVLGVVVAPALGDRGVLYCGLRGAGAWKSTATPGDALRQAIRVRRVPAVGLTVVGSRSHGDDVSMATFLAGRPVARFISAGSSLKLCMVAEGAADLYPRLGRTMEWDIAAGHAVLLAAGGQVRTLDGAPLRYGKPGFDNPHFLASARI
jgi:3'(2'), 5'-bisphosphate nucleotidase